MTQKQNLRVGDVADFSPGRIECFCGARSRSGYFHMCDSNGWRVHPDDVAEAGRPGYEKGDLLWDGASVVCSKCSAIYDSTTGTVTGFGTPPPEDYGKPKPSQEVSDEAREQHRPEGLLAKARRLFRRKGTDVPDSREDDDGLAAELAWQSNASAAVEAWKARQS